MVTNSKLSTIVRTLAFVCCERSSKPLRSLSDRAEVENGHRGQERRQGEEVIEVTQVRNAGGSSGGSEELFQFWTHFEGRANRFP